MGLTIDTNFVISMEREAKKPGTGRAKAFLEKHVGEQFVMPFTVAGELACGRSAADKQTWKQLCRPFALLPWTSDVLWQYGELYRHLQSGGRLIGTNDLWIAATALVHDMPLVTNNVDEFKRVPGLVVLEY
jgi:tRNA(fMet)-specific endonuclease VapC